MGFPDPRLCRGVQLLGSPRANSSPAPRCPVGLSPQQPCQHSRRAGFSSNNQTSGCERVQTCTREMPGSQISGAARARESWAQSRGESHHFVPARCTLQRGKRLWGLNSSAAGFGLSRDAWPCHCSPSGLVPHPVGGWLLLPPRPTTAWLPAGPGYHRAVTRRHTGKPTRLAVAHEHGAGARLRFRGAFLQAA